MVVPESSPNEIGFPKIEEVVESAGFVVNRLVAVDEDPAPKRLVDADAELLPKTLVFTASAVAVDTGAAAVVGFPNESVEEIFGSSVLELPNIDDPPNDPVDEFPNNDMVGAIVGIADFD